MTTEYAVRPIRYAVSRVIRVAAKSRNHSDESPGTPTIMGPIIELIIETRFGLAALAAAVITMKPNG